MKSANSVYLNHNNIIIIIVKDYNIMRRIFEASIEWRCKKNHPDTDDTKTLFKFSDKYMIDDDYFYDDGNIESYIKHDLKLVAGGGYDTDTIKDVKITIKEV